MNPEALRHGLQFVYGWVPVGAAVAAIVLLVRATGARRRAGHRLVRVAGAVALAVVAVDRLQRLLPPRAAAADGRLLRAAHRRASSCTCTSRTLAQNQAAVTIGAAWLAFLVAAGVGLTLKDANAESSVVRGSNGSLAETPDAATIYAGATAWIERETEPGERILVLPLLTGLDALTGRTPGSAGTLRAPRASSNGPTEERDAIAALEENRVRLVVTDDRTWPAYGQGAFGDDFGRELAAWIASNYDRVATVSAGTADPRTLTIWRRGGE